MDTHTDITRQLINTGSPSQSSDSLVVLRSLAILTVLSGLYLIWLYNPPFTGHYGTHWTEIVGLCLACGGAIAWAAVIHMTAGSEESAWLLVRRTVLVFLASALLNLILSVPYELLTREEGQASDFRITFFLLQVLFANGIGGVFAYSLVFRLLPKLKLVNVALYIMAWHVLYQASSGLLIHTFANSNVSILTPVYSVIFPFTYGPAAALSLAIATLSLLVAWWVSRGASSVPREARSTRGTWLGDILCDLIDGNLSLTRIFWYLAMIGGHLVSLVLISLAMLDSPSALIITVLITAALFWSLLFIRLIQAGARYNGSTIWEVLAVIIVGAQVVAYLVTLITIWMQ